MHSSKNEKFTDFDLPVTDKISKSQVSVPIYPGLNKEEVVDILQKHWRVVMVHLVPFYKNASFKIERAPEVRDFVRKKSIDITNIYNA